VFKYLVGAHNIFKVTDFANCVVPTVGGGLTTGNDVITFATPGNNWYISGIGKHLKPEDISLPSMCTLFLKLWHLHHIHAPYLTSCSTNEEDLYIYMHFICKN
ncbi:hypothetical protein GIB67_034197, partial [Kingdonia uniflora]